MITNFNKCELGATYQVRNHELIIARISTKTSGKCTHNIYHGTIDGEPFSELNSPQLKRLLGMDTLQYERGGERKPSEPRTPRTKRANAATWHAKANKLFGRIMAELGEDDNLRYAWVDYLNRKTSELRHQETIEEEKRKQEAAKKKMLSSASIKKARIKRLNEYINSYDSQIVEVMKTDLVAAQMMAANKEEKIEKARRLIAVLG
jgi:hypothetical protein